MSSRDQRGEMVSSGRNTPGGAGGGTEREEEEKEEGEEGGGGDVEEGEEGVGGDVEGGSSPASARSLAEAASVNRAGFSCRFLSLLGFRRRSS